MDSPYDRLESALAFLRRGFAAKKFNFSNGRKKQVHVRLSPSGKYLEYASSEGRSIKTFLKPSGKIYLIDVKDFLYGGLTSTFKRHEANNMKLMIERREAYGKESQANLNESAAARRRCLQVKNGGAHVANAVVPK